MILVKIDFIANNDIIFINFKILLHYFNNLSH